MAAIEEALRGGRKIVAIKNYREMTGAGLAEAKDAVEDWNGNCGPTIPAARCCRRGQDDCEPGKRAPWR
jgi:hypothetical protein